VILHKQLFTCTPNSNTVTSSNTSATAKQNTRLDLYDSMMNSIRTQTHLDEGCGGEPVMTYSVPVIKSCNRHTNIISFDCNEATSVNFTIISLILFTDRSGRYLHSFLRRHATSNILQNCIILNMTSFYADNKLSQSVNDQATPITMTDGQTQHVVDE